MSKIYRVQHKIHAAHDFDGNIIDTMRLHGELAADCMYRHFSMSKDQGIEEYHATTGIPFPEQLKTIFPDSTPAQRNTCEAEYVDRKIREVYAPALLFPNVTDTITMLNDMGVPNTIATSTEEELTRRLLRKYDIDDLFDLVWGCERGSKSDHISHLKTKNDTDLIVFTGDSRSDVALSNIPGVVTVGRTGNPESGLLTSQQLHDAGANYIVDDFSHLVSIVRSLDEGISEDGT